MADLDAVRSRLAEVRKLEAEATPVPWEFWAGDIHTCRMKLFAAVREHSANLPCQSCSDADMIIAARNALPTLLACAEALLEIRPAIAECAAPEAVYGFFHGGDPRDFSPDPDASTEEERERHRLACEAYAKNGEGLPSCCEMHDGMLVTKAPFGLGVNTYQDAEAVRLLRVIDAALAALAKVEVKA